MELIDTHQHLILRGSLGYAWTADVPAISTGLFDRAAYAADAGGHVSATIFMESGVDDSDYQAEARLIAQMIGTGEPTMLGQIVSCRPEMEDGFEAWLEECRDLHVVGFRRILQVMPDDLSRDQSYRRNIRRIGQAGWPVDLCFDARQLPIAYDLVRDCPETRFVLDHCGTPDIAGGDVAAWRTEMARLADLPNLWVKLSGLPAYCGQSTASQQRIRPYVESVLDLFGADRMLWGGDWPVVNVGGGLSHWIAMTRELLSPLSDDERASIGHFNARRFYLQT